MEETYTLAFQVMGRTKEKDPKDVRLGRRYHSRDAAHSLRMLLEQGGQYESVWVSEIAGKDGIT